MSTNIGIDEKHCQTISAGLSCLLADSYTLYLKTQNFHWNVTGPQFLSLHELFEEHYTDLAEAIDGIAERIRALGQHAAGSFSEYSKLTKIKEATQQYNAKQMCEQLLQDQYTLIATIRKVIVDAEKAEDHVSLGLLSARLEVHESNAWMLRSLIKE